MATLIELNPRFALGTDPSAYIAAQGHNQISALVDMYIRPKIFKEMIPITGIPLEKNLVIVWLIAPINKLLEPDIDWTPLKNLSSYHSLHFSYKVGDEIQKTTDFCSSPGYVYLVGPDEQLLAHDIELIRLFEKTLYEY